MANELEGLQKELEIMTMRLNALRESFAIQSDANLKFTLEMQIAGLEKELSDCRSKIKEAYGLDVFEESGVLDQKIRQLTIDTEIGEIHLVNCDRNEVATKFWSAFDQNIDRENHFQFYFVLADPSQQPNSFAERMIYEVIIEELEDEFGAINYERQRESRRVKVEDLPLGRNLNNSQKSFKKYFSRRFGLAEAKKTFEEYISTGLPRLDYEFVATVFDLNAGKWDQMLIEEYLQWIIDSFSDTHEDVPNFIFFFAIFLKDAHLQPLSGKGAEIIEGIKKIIAKNSERCTFFTHLLPVPVELLEDWIRDLGEHNQSKIDDLIKTIVAGLPKDKKEKYSRQNELDMSDIERFQQIVYRITR